MTTHGTLLNHHHRADALRFDIRPLINGELIEGTPEPALTVVNPATGQVLYRAHASREQDVDAAVIGARACVDAGTLAHLDSARRSRILHTMAEQLEFKRETLALYESLEIGKPISSALMEVDVAADILRSCASYSDKLKGSATCVADNAISLELLEPRGIAAAIIPWNFSTIQAASRIGNAIATGNACLLKPSEMAMAPALALGRIAVECDWPEAAIAVLPGDGEVGQRLAAAEVDIVSFIGSTATGRSVSRAAASSGFKRLSLECGGKSATVVLADAGALDLDAMARAIVQDVMWNQGQVCTARTRLIVEAPLLEALLERILPACTDWIAGDPLDPTTNFGPLASASQKRRVLGYLDRSLEAGANRIHGEGIALPAQGEYVAPTVLMVDRPCNEAFREEIFGPVLTVIPARDRAHAFELANDGSYGLAATLWTTSLASAHRFARQVKAGSVRVNGCNDPADEPLLAAATEPYKGSGIGVEGGIEGLRAWMRRKSALISF